jgi:hypothetical protein
VHQLFYSGPSLSELHNFYAKGHRIDEKAPLAVSSKIQIEAPVNVVWQAIINFRDWRHWAPATDMPDVPDVTPDVSFVWRLNGVRIHSRIAVVDARRELNWTGVFLWFKAVERYVLAPIGELRTQVTLEESLAGLGLVLFYDVRQLQANHNRWLTALKRYLEQRSDQ